MVFDYVVILRNTGRRFIDVLNLILASISLLIVMYYCYSHKDNFNFNKLYWVAFLSVAALIIIRSRRKKSPQYKNAILLITAGLSWLMIPYFWFVGIIILLLGVFEHDVRKNLEIGFSKDRIMYDDIFKKTYQWNEFSNIILKDNILTLDFKNNKVFQKETIDDESDCDEDEFNDFCREQLAMGNGQ